MLWKLAFAALATAGICVQTAWCDAAWREVLSFAVTTNTGPGRSLYVVGNQPELGGWQPTGAIRLAWSFGNVWSGRVAVRAGSTVEVQFISRVDSASQHCLNTNVLWPGVPNTTQFTAAPPPAPYPGKTLLYHSGWTNVFVLFSVDGTNFSSQPMERVGPGRFPGEYLHVATGFARAGLPVQFVCYGFLNGTQYWDNAPYPGFGAGDYYTPLDVFFLQDGHIYNYWPPAAPSAPTIVTQFIPSSWAPAVPGRLVRIYLPRGYSNNVWKRYPALYMHDGQNLFDPGGSFGSWGVEHTMNREVSQGRVREAIVVAVDNTTGRLAEYTPPGDNGAGPSGIGDLYANYLVHNVRPAVDTAFRTLTNLPNTLTAGSSMGGLISSYLVFRTNSFGKAGIFSPSWWAAPNFRGWIASNETLGARVYIDAGTLEGPSMWDHFWPVRGSLLLDGYAEYKDLLTVIGCGQGHNEAAWSNRLPNALRFLLSPWDEPNFLALQMYPPKLEWAGVLPTGLVHHALGGIRYVLETAGSPTGPWIGQSTSMTVHVPWNLIDLPYSPTAGTRFLRLFVGPP
ncbi:MAG: alpha/beta hydrolase-fold protein [Kiritimatiellae bacterium]|nr:alpha/beta hydrolase-fold protein [Kiritimatiellia bacterium]MDW8457740.1 alpha/beta hydrolase-fold protein [Verrucomicrobiota bacterium]